MNTLFSDQEHRQRHRLCVLVLALNLAWLAVPGAARSEVISGAYCLKQVVHIELGQVVPPLVGTPMVHAGVTHLAYIENLTDQSVRVEVPIHYWGDYRVWGSRAMQIEQGGASPRERIDTVALGYVTVPPNTKRRLMAIEIGRPQDVFRYPPEPTDVVRMPEYELVPNGVKCVLQGGATGQSPVPSSATTSPSRRIPSEYSLNGASERSSDIQAARAPVYLEPRQEVREIIGDDGAPMILITAGKFMMGSNEGEVNTKPVHSVSLKSFLIDKFEVTNELFEKFVKQTSYTTTVEKRRNARVTRPLPLSDKHYFELQEISGAAWSKPEGEETVFMSKRLTHPVVQVSWFDAEAYCRWAGRRLPTEAEFEYATRGGTQTTFWWGDREQGSHPLANTADEAFKKQFSGANNYFHLDDGYARTAPVGSFRPNSYGIHDMTGNVSEWVADWYEQNYYGYSSDDNPKGPQRGNHKVIRGGSWFSSPYLIQSASRWWDAQIAAYDWIGFRCAKDAS